MNPLIYILGTVAACSIVKTVAEKATLSLYERWERRTMNAVAKRRAQETGMENVINHPSRGEK